MCISNYSELRSVSNKLSEIKKIDVEDQTAKITVEEQMQLTTIQTLEIDLNSGMYHVCNLCICMCFMVFFSTVVVHIINQNVCMYEFTCM